MLEEAERGEDERYGLDGREEEGGEEGVEEESGGGEVEEVAASDCFMALVAEDEKERSALLLAAE